MNFLKENDFEGAIGFEKMQEIRKFIQDVDYLSLSPYLMSYEEFLTALSDFEIEFTEKFMANNKYVTVKHDILNYEHAFFLLLFTNIAKITRIDIKNDYYEPFSKFADMNVGSTSIMKEGVLQTIYYGSRQSDLFARFYDKRAESSLPYDLSRLEFEIKGELAHEFSYRLSYLTFDDALNFIYDKLNDFCVRHNLSRYWYHSIDSYLDFNIFDILDMKRKLRYFYLHNHNTCSDICKFYNISEDDIGSILSMDKYEFEEYIENLL